ncbi:hypothetical protein VTO42DRAFT_8395 [Malbranchea cinnamomea]
MPYSFLSKHANSPLLPTQSTTSSRPKKSPSTAEKSKFPGASSLFSKQATLTFPLSSSSSTSSPSSSSNIVIQSPNPAPPPPAPYPGPILSSSTPHPHVTIDPVRTAHVPSLMRITALLLPVRYPNKFYTATITDSLVASVSRVAVYHDQPSLLPSGSSPPGIVNSTESASASSVSSSDKVIGGIRCRLEPIPPVSLEQKDGKTGRTKHNLYIQTLHLLSPYRGHGIASALLESIIYDPSSEGDTSTSAQRSPSAIAKHYNIRTVTAHVHEANDEALHWYVARGFEILPGVVEGYYKRLNPTGAKVVQLRLNWDDNAGDSSPRVQKRDDCDEKENDDDWEKVEPEDCSNAVEKLEEYCTIDEADLEESSRKKLRSR